MPGMNQLFAMADYMPCGGYTDDHCDWFWWSGIEIKYKKEDMLGGEILHNFSRPQTVNLKFLK